MCKYGKVNEHVQIRTDSYESEQICMRSYESVRVRTKSAGMIREAYGSSSDVVGRETRTSLDNSYLEDLYVRVLACESTLLIGRQPLLEEL